MYACTHVHMALNYLGVHDVDECSVDVHSVHKRVLPDREQPCLLARASRKHYDSLETKLSIFDVHISEKANFVLLHVTESFNAC